MSGLGCGSVLCGGRLRQAPRTVLLDRQPVAPTRYLPGRPQILPWLSISVPGMSNLCALTATTALALWCFAACILFDPGRCLQAKHGSRHVSVCGDALWQKAWGAGCLGACVHACVASAGRIACVSPSGCTPAPAALRLAGVAHGPPYACRVPDGWQPDVEGETSKLQEVKKKVRPRQAASQQLHHCLLIGAIAGCAAAACCRSSWLLTLVPSLSSSLADDCFHCRGCCCGLDPGSPGWRPAVLPKVQGLQAAKDAPLQCVQQMRPADGPPLPLVSEERDGLINSAVVLLCASPARSSC